MNAGLRRSHFGASTASYQSKATHGGMTRPPRGLTLLFRRRRSQESSPNNPTRQHRYPPHFIKNAWKGRWGGASTPDDHRPHSRAPHRAFAIPSAQKMLCKWTSQPLLLRSGAPIHTRIGSRTNAMLFECPDAASLPRQVRSGCRRVLGSDGNCGAGANRDKR